MVVESTGTTIRQALVVPLLERTLRPRFGQSFVLLDQLEPPTFLYLPS